MAAHRRLPSGIEGRFIQVPGMRDAQGMMRDAQGMMRDAQGMMCDAPLRGIPHDKYLEPLPVPELIKRKVIAQEDEIKRVEIENHRFAASHATLRQDILGTHQELRKLQAHFGSIKNEADIEVRVLLEKIAKMEADIRDGEMVKKDLQQAHFEAQNLVNAREKLSSEIQTIMDELQKASTDFKPLLELHAELDGLRKEHQNLRVAFEYEKGSNLRQMDQMRGIERNLMSLTREAEKLRAEVLNAEQRANSTTTQFGASYNSTDMAYAAAGHTGGYADNIYMQNGGYAAAGYGYNAGHPYAGTGQVPPANYPVAYGGALAQMNTGAPGGTNPYGYTDPYGRSQLPTADGLTADGIHPGNDNAAFTTKDAQNGPSQQMQGQN